MTTTRDRRASLGSYLLDFRLALRMLVRYPLLTIVGVVGMAFGIAAGVTGFEIRAKLTNPTVPLNEGSRIVGLRNWDARRDRPAPLGDTEFRAWREQLAKVDDVSAAALVDRNLTVNGTIEPVSVAEMTASGFRVARVLPQLGRTLIETDESPAAPPVAVIGHALWQRRFLGDPAIVGRTVRLGIEQTTIVGVMPAEFGFPVAHEVWTPLRRPTVSTVSDAETLMVFGRLASGVTRTEAQAELLTIGQRMAADSPDTHQFLRPEVVPYAHLILDPRRFGVALTLGNIFLIVLILVVCTNVALLMFARAAAREVEIGVRNALGASRGRIVAQLFAEALALAGLSVIAGHVAARFAIGSLLRTREADLGRALPFWVNDSVTPHTIAYAAGLMLLGAVIIGVFPALKITAGDLQSRLRNFTAGGGGYRFGGVWTGVLAAQVAITVLFPATAFFFAGAVSNEQARDVGFPAAEYLSARLVLDGANTHTVEELRRQLTAEPGVSAVTFADRLPGMLHPGGRFEVEADEAPPESGHEVRVASIDADFFGALGAPVLSGRGFTPTDVALGREVAIVNTLFVERVLRGRNPEGRRIRRLAADREQSPGPWIEIVGVVRALGVNGTEGIGLYRPLAPGSSTMHVALHARGAPGALVDQLRAIAGRVEPTLRLYDVMPLDRVGADQWLESQYMSRLLTVLSGIALLLSLMGIYSVTAFTVVQRTREIGVRVALGAGRWRIVAPIIGRPLMQIGIGIVAGTGLVVLAFVGLMESIPTPLEASVIAAYATSMLVVSLLACGVPIRRALRLQPSQVLRADG